jgi:hypothetical protein
MLLGYGRHALGGSSVISGRRTAPYSDLETKNGPRGPGCTAHLACANTNGQIGVRHNRNVADYVGPSASIDAHLPDLQSLIGNDANIKAKLPGLLGERK